MLVVLIEVARLWSVGIVVRYVFAMMSNKDVLSKAIHEVRRRSLHVSFTIGRAMSHLWVLPWCSVKRDTLPYHSTRLTAARDNPAM
jgi:hypothetical protein